MQQVQLLHGQTMLYAAGAAFAWPPLEPCWVHACMRAQKSVDLTEQQKREVLEMKRGFLQKIDPIMEERKQLNMQIQSNLPHDTFATKNALTYIKVREGGGQGEARGEVGGARWGGDGWVEQGGSGPHGGQGGLGPHG